jgi:magnesium chelatase family protein
VNAPGIDALASSENRGESSAAIRERVERAIAAGKERFKGSQVRRNAGMPPPYIDKHCGLNDHAHRALTAAVEKLGLSGRAYHGILRVSRSIADLDGKDAIGPEHILEAVQHRRMGDDPYDVFQAD